MVQPPGIPFREFRQRIELVTLQSGASCNKGDVLIGTSTGYVQATQSLAGSDAYNYCIALAAVVGVSGVQATVRAMFEGAVGVNKLNNTVVNYGQALGVSTSAGQVDVMSVANLYGAHYQVGWAMEAAISGNTSVGLFITE